MSILGLLTKSAIFSTDLDYNTTYVLKFGWFWDVSITFKWNCRYNHMKKPCIRVTGYFFEDCAYFHSVISHFLLVSKMHPEVQNVATFYFC